MSWNELEKCQVLKMLLNVFNVGDALTWSSRLFQVRSAADAVNAWHLTMEQLVKRHRQKNVSDEQPGTWANGLRWLGALATIMDINYSVTSKHI